MKKCLFFLMIIISLLMVSCVNDVDSSDSLDSMTVVKLADIEGKYIIDDMRSLGTWVLMFEKDDIEVFSEVDQSFCIKIGNKVYEMKMNPFNDGLYIAFLPEELDLQVIRGGSILMGSVDTTVTSRNAGTISLEKVTIEKGELNGTNLYELTLELYVFFNTASDEGKRAYLYNGDTFLQPKYVRSDEEDGYTLDLYYNGRAAADVRDADGAFRFLQNRPDHETTLLLNYDANRVSVNGEFIVEDAPDHRERIRELGDMGGMSGNNTWNIVDDPSNSLYRVYVKRSELPVAYQAETEFSLMIKGATECDFVETATPGIFEATVSYANTSGMELLKNARFYVTTPFDGGSGTQSDPYRIANWQQLAGINEKAEYLTKHYVQVNDLDDSTPYYDEYASATANGGQGWNPVGGLSTFFTGSFNGEYEGDKYKIKDFRIDRNQDGVGLFGFISNGAALYNITIEDAQVVNILDQTALLVGCILTQSFIEGCFASGTVTGTGLTSRYSAILVGCNYGGSIKSSGAVGTVSAGAEVGLVVGFSSLGSLVECYAGEGTAKANAEMYMFRSGVGGFAGELDCSTVRYCYSRANSIGKDKAGGFAGFVTNGSSIENSYSMGNASGDVLTGGFIGEGDTSSIENCYCACSNIGFYGLKNSGTVTSCYWLDSVSGTDSGGAISRTDAEMRLEETFINWNFLGEEAWWIHSGEHTSYPYLILNEQIPAPGYQ